MSVAAATKTCVTAIVVTRPIARIVSARGINAIPIGTHLVTYLGLLILIQAMIYKLEISIRQQL